MSLQNLISGAECALPNNPLAQVLKHTEGDRSAQRDRIAGPSSSRLHHLPTTSAAPTNERDLALARQFFEANAGPSAGPGAMQMMPPNLRPSELAHQLQASGPDLQDAWMRMEMQKQNTSAHHMQHDSAWAAEFGAAPPHLQSSVPSSQAFGQAPQQSFAQSSYMPTQSYYQSSMSMGMYGMGMNQQYNPMQQDLGKGKGKSRQEDFEAAFAQFSAAPVETARIVEIKDDDQTLEAAMQGASLAEPKEIEESVDYGTDFKKVWDHLQKSEIPPPQADVAKWEAEFNQLMSSQRDELDYAGTMQNAWENGLGDYDSDLSGPSLQFDDQGIPALGDYVFEQNNKYLTQPEGVSPLGQAKALLEQNGSLSEAALLLEAAIQKGDLGEGGYEAWILLGETRSMDEREEAGMRALKEGARRAEAAGAAGAGMLSLAISYTNESYERASLTTLLRWLVARFPGYTPPPETVASTQSSPWDTQQRVTDAFLAVARQQHAQGVVDPDVQTGLGVLFYNSGDFARAKDCFESALSVRPKDYLLWNRLGSSLSNGSRPEEALGAYREALSMRPTYTRAIYNVGVACLNIGAHREAAEHFLSALALQDSTGGDKSEQLWFTLRRVLSAMNREDLAEKAKAGASLEAFRAEGFDF